MVPMSVSDGPGRISSWAEILAFARHAESVGLDSIWVCDHFLSSPPGGPVEGIHEGWTILSVLAASTSRVEVVSLVMCNSFRNPALLAKMAVTADAVSDGRLVLGLGGGWYDAEYVAFGYPTDHRVGRFEEALQIITALLSGDSVSFSGRYYDLREAALLPPPQRPIPILIAAKGPRMLSLVARHADAWTPPGSADPTIAFAGGCPIWRKLWPPKAETQRRCAEQSAWRCRIPTRPSPAAQATCRFEARSPTSPKPSTSTPSSASTTSSSAYSQRSSGRSNASPRPRGCEAPTPAVGQALRLNTRMTRLNPVPRAHEELKLLNQGRENQLLSRPRGVAAQDLTFRAHSSDPHLSAHGRSFSRVSKCCSQRSHRDE
jgi:hypothetical protein